MRLTHACPGSILARIVRLDPALLERGRPEGVGGAIPSVAAAFAPASRMTPEQIAAGAGT